MLNKIQLIGRLGADPEFKQSGSATLYGILITAFLLACLALSML